MVAVSYVRRVALALLSIVLAVWGLALVPPYSGPFSGCLVEPWLTLVPGCSNWDEVLRGALFVLPFAVLHRGRWLSPAIASSILLLFALLGGVDSARSGEAQAYHFPYHLLDGFAAGYPLFLGGLAVLLCAVFVRRVTVSARPRLTMR
jgi:hypothetical protein